MAVKCCLCEWKKRQINEAIQRFHFTSITPHLAVIPDWNTYNTCAMTGKATSLWIIFPPIKAKPQTLFPLTGCFYSLLDAKWQTGSGGTSLGKLLRSSPHQPNQRLAMLSAWCYCADQKLGFREPLWNFDAVILSMTHRFLCHCLATELVVSTAGELAASKLSLSVNQYWWLTSEEKRLHRLHRPPPSYITDKCTVQKTELPFERYR